MLVSRRAWNHCSPVWWVARKRKPETDAVNLFLLVFFTSVAVSIGDSFTCALQHLFLWFSYWVLASERATSLELLVGVVGVAIILRTVAHTAIQRLCVCTPLSIDTLVATPWATRAAPQAPGMCVP